MARIVSVLTSTDEHYNRDRSKIYFSFYDDDKEMWYNGAITYAPDFSNSECSTLKLSVW